MRIFAHSAECTECGKTFYELDGEELDVCPHCESDTKDALNGPTLTIDIVVDPVTGEIEVNA